MWHNSCKWSHYKTDTALNHNLVPNHKSIWAIYFSFWSSALKATIHAFDWTAWHADWFSFTYWTVSGGINYCKKRIQHKTAKFTTRRCKTSMGKISVYDIPNCCGYFSLMKLQFLSKLWKTWYQHNYLLVKFYFYWFIILLWDHQTGSVWRTYHINKQLICQNIQLLHFFALYIGFSSQAKPKHIHCQCVWIPGNWAFSGCWMQLSIFCSL